MRCSFCSDLSVECLVDLATQEFSSFEFPSTAFYQHHASFRALADSADAGCDLCQLIADCFRGIRWETRTGLSFAPESWEGSACDPDHSAFAAAKALDASDVKLAINTTHLYSLEPLENVLVLSSLLVQVGITDSFELDGPDADIPFLTLTLSTPPEKAVNLGTWRIGRRQVDPDLRSAANFDIARSWLAECRTHQGCFTKGPRKLPTRVVDTGPLGSPMRPRVFLSRGAEADYIALSHCWGGPIPTLLSSETYDEYQQSLPYDELPANFQDAFLISRELGIRYVWIDSLCIIQDSTSDWEVESKRMAEIYRNATLTVSALVSERSTTGILRRFDDNRNSTPKSASLKVYRDQARTEEVRVEWRPFEEENLNLLDSHGPLNKRGWCLQESLLSPSNLLFGGRQIYWRCCAGSKSADATPDGFEFPFYRFPAASQVIYSGISGNAIAKELAAAPDTIELLGDYYPLAQRYSCRSLTVASDKLPAFSGIARSLHPAIGGEYLAGIWTSDLCYGLLWRADTRSARHVDEYRAPSWSWMATDEPILFEGTRLPPSDGKIQLLEHAVRLKDESNPYGCLVSSHIVVRGPTRPLLLTRQAFDAGSVSAPYNGLVHYDEPPMESQGIFDLYDGILETGEVVLISAPSGSGKEGLRIEPEMIEDALMLVLLVQAGVAEELQGGTTAYGLAVRHVADHEMEGAFERVGFVRFLGCDLELFERWDDSTLVLV